MRAGIAALALAGFLALAGCESKSDQVVDKQADAIEGAAEARADAIEDKAAFVEEQGGDANLARADALEKQAEAVREAGIDQANALAASSVKKD